MLFRPSAGELLGLGVLVGSSAYGDVFWVLGSGVASLADNHFATYARQVFDNGYSINTVVRGRKDSHPELPRDRYCWMRPQLEDVERVMKTHGDCGLGLPTGRFVVVIDIDTECERLNERLLRIVESICGETPLLRQGRPPRFSAIYSAREPVLSIRLPQVDVLGLMTSCNAYGVHPDTGEEYKWLRGHAPHTLPLSNLPQIGNRETLAFMNLVAGEMFRDRFSGFELKLDDNFLPLVLASRSVLLAQFASRVVFGKKYARRRAQREIYQSIRSGCWGLTFAPRIDGPIQWTPDSNIDGWGQE